MKIALFSLIALTIVGCSMAGKTNIVEVQKGAILAQGGPTRDGERLDLLDIDLRKMSSSDKTSFWVEFPDNKRMALSGITLDEVKSRSTKEYLDPEVNIQRSFYVGGYLFKFSGNTLILFGANKHGFPPTKRIAFTRIGSFSTSHFLTLPCTLIQFEEVFGKPDDVKRRWSW